MSNFKVCLFGKLSIQDSYEMRHGLDTQKVQQLLCYLLIFRHKAHSRERLAGILWGENSTIHSKKYLRQALWMLQGALETVATFDKTPLLLTDDNWISLNPQAKYWLDVAEFEEAYKKIHSISAPANLIDPQCVEMLRNAVNLYSGDLLEGWYDDWCIFERDRLQNIYLAILESLAAYCEICQDWQSGLNYCLHILRNDRAFEPAHVQMMRLYYLSGNRTKALRQYEYCTAVLKEELNVTPSRKTRELYHRMRSEQFDLQHNILAQNMDIDTRNKTKSQFELLQSTDPLYEALNHVRQLQGELSSVQSLLQNYIQKLEQALQGNSSTFGL